MRLIAVKNIVTGYRNIIYSLSLLKLWQVYFFTDDRSLLLKLTMNGMIDSTTLRVAEGNEFNISHSYYKFRWLTRQMIIYD